MNRLWQGVKQNFWPISAIIFCPCHLPLTMAAVASLTAGTALGAYLSMYYNSIESVLAVAFSFYFVVAFMIWVVSGPKQPNGAACVVDATGKKQLSGLSTKNIIVWGVIGMFMMPALVSISFFTERNLAENTVLYSVVSTMEYSSGFIWLVSIATVVMIPVMVIWLVWMWLAWSKTDRSQAELENWTYEYE